jgi:hypothetical protein
VFKFFLVLTMTVCLTACMTTQPFSPDDKKQIHTISVDAAVKVPTEMYYMGPGVGYVGMLSLIPGISSVDKLNKAVASNKIQIDAIVRRHFMSDLRRDTHLNVTDDSTTKADAHLQLEIKQYGFGVPQSYSFEVVPVLAVEAKLIRHNVVIWQNSYRTSALFSDATSYQPDALIANPKLVSTSWNSVAEKVATRLVNDLK